MRTFYVHSGTLKGYCVSADDAWHAVELAVRQQVAEQKHCVLGPLVRVCVGSPCGAAGENLMEPPYEDHFQELFDDEDLDFEVASVG